MKRLIVNADDFGFTRGVNRAIARAFRTGILRSATVMANGEMFDDAIELARDNPGLGVGCHLAVVGGRPVAPPTEVASLVDGSGMLPSTLTKLFAKLARGSVTTVHLVREFGAQVQRAVTAGIAPSHLDTHKHSHIHPQVAEALAQVAAEFAIKRIRNPFERILSIGSPGARAQWSYVKQCVLSAAVSPWEIQFRELADKYGLKTPDRFLGVKLTGMLDSKAIRSIMESLGEGTAELMCHPGEYDDDLERAHTRLKRERERELEALCDPSVIQLGERMGIELINYREL